MPVVFLQNISEVLQSINYYIASVTVYFEIGTYVGALAAVAPDRRGDISEIAFRAAVNGNIAGFLTACIAGTFRIYCCL